MGLRFDQEIHLSNDFPTQGGRPQQVRIPIPGLEIDKLNSCSPPQPAQEQSSPPRPQFQSALSLVREAIGTDRRLTLELVRSYEQVRQWRERWGYSPLSSDALESPPPYSPPQDRHFPTIASSPLPDHSSSPVPDAIPNPLIPGDPAPSAEVLFEWMVVAEALEEGKWLLRQHSNPEHRQHNHSRSIGPSAHPSHRRLTEPIRTTVESTSRRVGIRAPGVRAIVQEQHPESSFTRKDIYNARSRINRDKLDGHTPTAALIKLLDEMKIPYLIKWGGGVDEPNHLVGLVWAFPYCLQMWKRFPEVISFDNTYNTNRFKLPLFQTTGQACLGSVYNAAFGLIGNERRKGFQFLSGSIRQLAEQHSIRQPDVIVTDFDDQMKAASNDQFPDVQQQLCIHHINSNVLLKSKQKWVRARSTSRSSSPDTSDRGNYPAATSSTKPPRPRVGSIRQ
ncbi:hypothetical protein BFJ63_vAg16470 [Fusarium oxysporum f. sp. narcissi]|uniref:MULE transposase domain-containing protein n=2 Tax=Fusarium oxysporum TaxID=5507 RepID=A0A4Q2V6M9_FUSOX|nr:hypothetical protein BFJ63_vAg16470 [Fusarium oxysporum f. sp. narcissi]